MYKPKITQKGKTPGDPDMPAPEQIPIPESKGDTQ